MTELVGSRTKTVLLAAAQDAAALLNHIPMVNRLGFGSGLAVRAHVRAGDALMQELEDGLHHHAGRRDVRLTLYAAHEHYNEALAIAAKRYGVDRYFDNGSWRSDAAGTVPDKMLCRTKFGAPIPDTSRREMLQALAHRVDMAIHISRHLEKVGADHVVRDRTDVDLTKLPEVIAQISADKMHFRNHTDAELRSHLTAMLPSESHVATQTQRIQRLG